MEPIKKVLISAVIVAVMVGLMVGLMVVGEMASRWLF